MFRVISAFVSGYPDSWFPWFTLLVWFVFVVHSFRAQIRLSTRLYIVAMWATESNPAVRNTPASNGSAHIDHLDTWKE